jgi:hypothetical protein
MKNGIVGWVLGAGLAALLVGVSACGGAGAGAVDGASTGAATACTGTLVATDGSGAVAERFGAYTVTVAKDGEDAETGTIAGPEGTVSFRIDDRTGQLTTTTALDAAGIGALFQGADDAVSGGAGDRASCEPASLTSEAFGAAKGLGLHAADDRPGTPNVRCAAEGQAFEAADSRVNAAAFTTLAAFYLHHVGSAVGISWYNAREDRSRAAAALGACCYRVDENFDSYYCNQVYWLYWPLSVPGRP